MSTAVEHVKAHIEPAEPFAIGTRVRIARDDGATIFVGEYGVVNGSFERRYDKNGRVISTTIHSISVRFDTPVDGFSGRWYRPEDLEIVG